MINFPDSPSVGSLFQSGGSQWRWTGVKWTPSTPASPVDALALNGMQINGDMRISQELGLGATRTTNGYLIDGWQFGVNSATAALVSGQYNGGPIGSNLMIQITVSTASVSPAAGDYVYFLSQIEGYRIARLGWGYTTAQPITVAFWTAHHRTGLYSVFIRNGAVTRSYAATYTQNVADAWEYKTITIPGDTAGTWNIDNTTGINFGFGIMCGTTYTAPIANTWYAANYIAAPGQVNGIAATTDVFRLTGVIVMPGSAAPTQANQPFCFRPYDQELLLCKRYYLYETYGASNIWFHPLDIAAGYRRISFRFFPIMRATPTIVITAVTSGTFSTNQPGAGSISQYSAELLGDVTAAGSFYTYLTSIKADARL